MASETKADIILFFLNRWSVFFLWLLSVFSLSLIFCSWKMKFLHVVFLELILLFVLWAFWICSLVSEIIGKVSVITVSNICSVSFCLLLIFPSCNSYTFCGYPIILGYCVLFFFFQSLLYLLFDFQGFFLFIVFQLRDSFLSHTYPTNNAYWRHYMFLL